LTRHWPKGFDARDFTPEEREVLIIDERFKLIEAAIKELQETKK